MKPRIRPSIFPQCSSCIRSYIDTGLGSQSLRPFLQQQQTRGAKSRSTPDTLPVVLLQNIDGYGRKGSFIQLPRGLMRNRWFPHKQARYATMEEIRAVKAGNIDCARDYGYERPSKHPEGNVVRRGTAEVAWKAYLGNDTSSSAAAAIWRANEAKAEEIKIQHIEPQRAIEVLGNLLPDILTFERKSVPKTATSESEKSKLPASVQAMLKASMPEERLAIFGSVSSMDIANYIRDHVSYNDEAAMITLQESNVKFIDLPEGEDEMRVKHLGKYEVEIAFKGAENILHRKVEVIEPRGNVAGDVMDPALSEPSLSRDVRDEAHS